MLEVQRVFASISPTDKRTETRQPPLERVRFFLSCHLNNSILRFAAIRLVFQYWVTIYADDVICGANSEDSAYKLFLESKEMLKLGGFNLRKFVTNSEEVQERINEKEGQSGLRNGE